MAIQQSPFIPWLRARLEKALPGPAAQLNMSSRPERIHYPDHDQYRESAVLAMFYPIDKQLHLALMKRTEDGKVHSGQVSFPGGKMEPEDVDAQSTALREANEELNIPSEEVQILGALSKLYIQPSNFMVYPIVGFMRQRPIFAISEVEVAELIEVPFSAFLDPSKKQTVSIKLRENWRIKAPAYLINGHTIWGATAMMISELLSIAQEWEFISQIDEY